MAMNGTASRTPTPRNMKVKMFERASGWRAMASTALDATLPSPTAEPKATPEMMMPKARNAMPMINACGFKDFPFSVVLRDRQRKIDDCEQGEHERLNGADEKVEKLNEERHDRYRQREVHRAEHHFRRDDGGDDDEQQLADEDVEEQTREERSRTEYFVDDVQRKQRGKRLEQMFEVRRSLFAERDDLDQQKDGERVGQHRNQVGRRRTTERQAHDLER